MCLFSLGYLLSLLSTVHLFNVSFIPVFLSLQCVSPSYHGFCMFLSLRWTSLFESSHLFLHLKHAMCHFYFILWLLDANHPETVNFSQLSNGLGFCRLGGGQTFRVALESPSRIIAASTQLWVWSGHLLEMTIWMGKSMDIIYNPGLFHCHNLPCLIRATMINICKNSPSCCCTAVPCGFFRRSRCSDVVQTRGKHHVTWPSFLDLGDGWMVMELSKIFPLV